MARVVPVACLLGLAVGSSVSAQTPGLVGGVEVSSFTNISGQPNDAWIGQGVADVVTADLIAAILETRNSSHWLVRGAYERIGNRIRITADLVRADTGLTVTSVEVEGFLADLFGLQDAAAARLVAALLSDVSRSAPPRAPAATVSEVPQTLGLVNSVASLIDGPPAPIAPDVITRDEFGRVTMRAIRLHQPLTLDGRLDEQVYYTVDSVTDFVQQVPDEGAPATEKTEVWVLFDRDTFYVAARCWSADPERIVANEMKRDSENMFGNETFSIMLDTFYDRRNAFAFLTNALGGFIDLTIANERTPNMDWNTVLDVQTERFDEGWMLEIAIPFKSLRYGTNPNQIWGVNFQRRVTSINESSFLTPVPAALGVMGMMQVSSGATLVDLEVPVGGKPFEIKPYVISGLTTNLDATPQVLNEFGRDAGFDIKYGVTQGLTADFTYNTDFAQVEVDEQQVNLTRFSLFFPEKREFFLEGQGVFEFGGGFTFDPNTIWFRGQRYGGDAPVLFFSRRIGLQNGRTVPIHAGGRLTGKVGPYSIGLLDVQAGQDSISGARPTNFSVARIKRDVLRRSAVGAMFTGRSVSTEGAGGNYVYGVDGVFSFYDNLDINSYLARTETPGLHGDDLSYQTQLKYNGDRWGLQVDRLAIGEHFNPEIGFLRRKDMRRNFASFRFSPRPQSIGVVRKFTWLASVDHITDGTGLLETRLQQGLFSAEFENGDQFFAGVTDNYEFLKEPFTIARNVTIPTGGYSFLNSRLVYVLGQQRVMSGSLTVDRGEFYNGEWTSVGYARGRIGLSSQLSVEPSLSVNWVKLPQGNFTTELVSTRATYTLTPRMFVAALLQYNSGADSLGSNIRLRWEYQPGSELFIVYTDERDTLTPHFPGIQNRAFIIKFNRLFRF